jgi:hypothetical protein
MNNRSQDQRCTFPRVQADRLMKRRQTEKKLTSVIDDSGTERQFWRLKEKVSLRVEACVREGHTAAAIGLTCFQSPLFYVTLRRAFLAEGKENKCPSFTSQICLPGAGHPRSSLTQFLQITIVANPFRKRTCPHHAAFTPILN